MRRAPRTLVLLAALLGPGAAQEPAPFALDARDGTLSVLRRGRPVAVYQAGERIFDAHPAQKRAGYFRELRSPSGVLLTEDGPGDHLHHRGLFLAWNRVTWEEEGRPPATVNFWELTPASGRKTAGRLSGTHSDAGSAGFEVSHDWQIAGRRCLEEALRCRVHEPSPGIVALDLDVTLSAVGGPVLLDEYGHHGGGRGPWYGTLGFRGAAAFEASRLRFAYSDPPAAAPKDNARLEGRWIALEGELEGSPRGAALISRPGSLPCRFSHFRGLRFLDADISDPHPVRVVPGTPLSLSFRVLLFDGPLDAARIEELSRQAPLKRP